MHTSHRSASSRILVALASALAVAGCARAVPTMPVPPAPGAFVKVTFAQPRGIAVTSDSSLVLSELNGRVVAVRGDTMVVSLTFVPGQGNTTRWAGHEVSIPMDVSTNVAKTNIDSVAGKLGLFSAIAFFELLLEL